jgi:hypothetical protein
MEHHTSASVEVNGSVLRYAEVVREGDAYRLVRLGSCEFDFDLEESALHTGGGPWADTLARALKDIFAGSAALDLHIALHPLMSTSFFVPIPAGMPMVEREAQLRDEVALVLPGEEAIVTAEFVRPEVLPDGATVNWFHVLALPATVAEAFDRVVGSLAVIRRRFCSSTSSVAAVLKHIARRRAAATPVATPYRLAIGSYADQTEYVLIRNQGWHYSLAVRAADPLDRAYFGAALLQRVSVAADELTEVFVYGTRIEPELRAVIPTLLKTEPETLDPLSLVVHESDGISDSFSAESYAACIGANLRDVYA